MKHIIICLLIAGACSIQAQSVYTADWESLDRRSVPQWWQDAKFGIFIHWGVYSVPAFAPTDAAGRPSARFSEWYYERLRTGNKVFTDHHASVYGDSSYADLAAQFRAEHFAADQWAKLFKQSGARYIVLTSKHCDGYALWPSEYSSRWNSMVLGSHRDLVGELSEAVKKQGLHMGFYYPFLEWGVPHTKETIGQWITEMIHPQMKELILRYKPEVLWTDGEWGFSDEELQSPEFLAWLYNESPVKDFVVVNDRWGDTTRGKHGGHHTTEYDKVYFDAKEEFTHPWEECRGIGCSFGYNQFEDAGDYMTSAQCIEMLVEKVSLGGNLLLNIGPKANGLIPVIMEERLLDMGKWLDVNGEAIYGTKAWKYRPHNMKETKVHFTKKPDALYVICTDWPPGSLVVDHISSADSVSLLGSDLPVDFSCADGKLTIQPPALNPGNMPCDFAWTFKVSVPDK